MANKEYQRRGKRNRQRGAELQREVDRMAKELELEAFNRDRGGAQHEGGDVEIADMFFGCKRRKKAALWHYPEKQEIGVFWKADRQNMMITIGADDFLSIIAIVKAKNEA